VTYPLVCDQPRIRALYSGAVATTHSWR
jgi:hypothetical protein